jgi:hypothetical protein
MATESNRTKKAIVAMTFAWTLAFPFLANGDGGTSGGGTGKPAVSFGKENFSAILGNQKVAQILGLNFGIEAVALQRIDQDGYHYRVTANTRTKTIPCVIDVTVWNTDASKVDQVKVTDAQIVSGCSVENISSARKPSVLDKYPEIFARFPKGMNETRLYEDYLKIARELSPELRKEIREYMRTSDPKYYEVYSANAKTMADVFKAHPEAKENNALYVLSKVMGFDPNAEGLQMAVIVGLEFAPFFIVDAE